jgi:predicted ATPase/DNA-binding winged helix-turn-helix (wHTH) protein
VNTSSKKPGKKAKITTKNESQSVQKEKGNVASVLRFADALEIHLTQQRVVKEDREVKLTRTEWALLLALIEREGGLVEHKTLLEKVWGENYKKEESDYLLYVHIGKLRRKIEVDITQPRYILTEVGLGYRFAYPKNKNETFSPSKVTLPNNSVQLSDYSSPPPSTKSSKLPVALNSFVGREKQLEELATLLARPTLRQLTLTGPGGVGKTRLALEVARRVEPLFNDGVFLVDLSFVNDPELVTDAISQTLEIKKETPNLTLLQHLKKHLANRQLLLILDNFEQVLPASTTVAELLANSTQLKILVTSRRVIRNYGEYEYNLPPLNLPSTIFSDLHLQPDLANTEAVRLFVERVQSYNHSFELNNTNAPTVAQICLQLDGLPLAIELAAARTRLVALPVLLNLLTDRFNLLTDGTANVPLRQQTLRTTIDWSYNLLSETAKNLFVALAIFEGSCNFEAVKFVCSGETGTPYDLLSELAVLVDQNMLQRVYSKESEPLFRLLKTHRDYALQQMVGSGQEPLLRQKHFDYYLNLIERAEPELKKAQQIEWLERLENEHNNFRAALAWISNQPEKRAAELALRMAGALGLFWYRRQHIEEGYKWLSTVLNMADRYNNITIRSAGLAKTLQRAAQLISQQPTKYDLAVGYLEKSISIWQELENKAGQALSLNHLGTLFLYHNQIDAAQQAHEQALKLSQELGDTYHATTLLVNLGMLARYRKDFAKAQNLFEQSLIAFRGLNDHYGVALTLCNLGIVYYDEGCYAQSEQAARQSLEQFEHLGDLNGQAFALHILALALYRQGKTITARSLLEKSLTLRIQIHDRRGIALSLRGLVLVSPPGVNVTRQWGASEKLRLDTRLPLFDADIADYNEALTKAKSDFSPELFEQLQSEGVLMLETGSLFKSFLT